MPFRNLSERERLALSLLALLLGLVLTWTLLWQPQRAALQDAERQYRDELQLAADLQRMPATSGGQHGTTINSGDLPGLLARTSAEANLNLERLDNEQQGRVNLGLSGSLDDLLAWLQQLGEQGVEVISANLEVNPMAHVRARLVLEVR
ncbi:type II secretion system protein GspM [Pseudomonas kulmbachensis]|uniref:Type II secretion system protein GspM n=1 Tax=Pseudomonas kulmbachensis TaxID=3043408 RepID=A0ABW7M1V4_9PSED|nr:type II secretion system protein GspM [Pseudomonas sp. FLM 004-28]